MIENEPDLSVVGDGRSVEEVEMQLRSPDVDVVLLDARLPGRSGSEAVAYLRGIRSDIKIVMLSTFGGDVEIRRCLAAGACDYVMKDAKPDDILKAVRKAFSSDRTHKVAPPEPSDLTPREAEILVLMAQGYRNKEIAHEAGVQIETVRWFAKLIYSKLGVSDRTEAVMVGLRRGIIVMDDREH